MGNLDTLKMGGFCGMNSSTIKYCYEYLKLNNKKYVTGGLVGQNTGEVVESYALIADRKLRGGLVGENSGTVTNGYYLDGKKEYSDKEYGISSGDLKKENRVNEEIFSFSDGDHVLKFDDDNWKYEVDKKDGQTEIVITSEQDLLDFIERVNQADPLALSAYIKLESDLNLHGRSLDPIGTTYASSFSGIFDGCCHTIKNFKIHGKNTKFAGFFGILRGEVYNLSVDCIVKGGETNGGFVAQNEGKIGCCSALIQLTNSKQTKFSGGFVGRNQGEIFQSYCAGKSSFAVIPPFWIVFGVFAISFTTAMGIYLLKPKPKPTFKPQPVDPDQEVITDDSIEETDLGNTVAFKINETVKMNLRTGKCSIHLINPTGATHNLVVSMFITSDEGDEYELASSQSIEPGHKLEEVDITDFAKENLSVGKYNANVKIQYFDQDNALSMVNSSVDVELEVTE